ILTALTVTTFQTYAGRLDWLFMLLTTVLLARDKPNSWCGIVGRIPARPSLRREVFLNEVGLFFFFNFVLTSGVNRSSYLVCFKLTEIGTEFRIIPVIQYASNPPTQNEIAIDKRLNRWPVSPPWEAGDDLPHKIKPPGLSIVLDKSRARSDQ